MKKIVVGFDASEQAADALALGEALRRAGDGELIVAAVDEVEPLVGDFVHWRELRDEYFEVMFKRAAEALGSSEFTSKKGTGSPPYALERIAEECDADVIVVGSSHRGKLGQVLAGSVGERLLHGSRCAVAIAPRGYGASEQPPVTTIGVAYDGQPESSTALEASVELARRFGASLRLISVVPVAAELIPGRIGHTQPGYLKALRRYFEERLEEGVASVPGDIECETKLIEGDPAADLAGEAAAEVDLLVLGSRGYGPLRRVLLGGVAREVVRYAPCPVVVLPRSARGEKGED